MRVVQWSAPERTIDQHEAGDFYDRPLAEPWLFHFRTRSLRLDPHGGPFSLKLVIRGQERYWFGTRQLCLRPGQLLFSPPERTYGSEISTPSECISLFVPPRTAWEAWSHSTMDHGEIVGGASPSVDWPVPVIFNAPQSVGHRLPALLSRLEQRQACECLMFDILAEAAQHWRKSAPVRHLTGRSRVATREELISRVVRARTMIDDLYGSGCDLSILANEACLSPFHFLRVFKEAFGETPARYARRVRLARAAELQLHGASPARAARAAGYSRPSALRRAQSSQTSIRA